MVALGRLLWDEWKGDGMEGETDGDRLAIASSVVVWVANLCDRRGNGKLVMEWRGRLTIASSVLVWVANLSDRASLVREWKGDGMEGETDGERLTIA